MRRPEPVFAVGAAVRVDTSLPPFYRGEAATVLEVRPAQRVRYPRRGLSPAYSVHTEPRYRVATERGAEGWLDESAIASR